jgi:hypothetical protein
VSKHPRTSQKTPFFIDTAVKTSKLTRLYASLEMLVPRAGFFNKYDLFMNTLDPQVRPPLPKKLPFSSVKDKLNSKLKLESMAEVYDYEDNYYVSKI